MEKYIALALHYMKRIHPVLFWYMLAVHILGILGLWRIPQCSNETLFFALILGQTCGLGITVGAHRLWAHRSFEASFPVRFVLMLLNCVANQGSILHWVRDHRVHHKHTETTADPHNAQNGFFFSHVGWLLIKKHKDVKIAGSEIDCSDVLEDWNVWIQDKCHPFLELYMCFIMPAQVASHFWGEEFWNGFFVIGATRYLIGLHATWCVNSVAHLFGDHPYDAQSYPAENPFVAFITLGEGWHNWHHKYPFDYATSEFGFSAQFNPSKVVIDLLAMFGQVWNRKRATAAWAMGRIKREKNRELGIPDPKPLLRPWEIERNAKIQ